MEAFELKGEGRGGDDWEILKVAAKLSAHRDSKVASWRVET